MNRKEVREWLKAQGALREKVDGIRKELEGKDLLGLLSLVELSEVARERIKLVIIAEYLRSLGLVDQAGEVSGGSTSEQAL